MIAACVGCVTRRLDGKTPAPEQEVPSGVVRVTRVSRWEVGFVARTKADPYPDRGLVFVLHKGSLIYGSALVQLWLPPRDHALQARIVNSFRAG